MHAARLLAFAIPYNWVTGIGVPVILTMIGVIGKKLARGNATSSGFKRQDFYLGPELTLAAVSSALLNIFDILKPMRTTTLSRMALLSNIIIGFMGIVLFMWVLSFHQDWESNGAVIEAANPAKPGKSVKMELFWLLLVCNVVGFGLLLAGIILIPEG